MTFHRVRSSRAFCAWTPRKDGGFQLLQAGKHAWWIFYGDTFIAEAVRVAKYAGGGWMLWYPLGAANNNQCPKSRTLYGCARIGKKLLKG